jgi:ribosomal protein L11 methyltransferase
MVWFQLKIDNCPGEEVEDLSIVLEELGALSIMLTDKNDNPVLEPAPGTIPLWPEVVIHALYAQAETAQLSRSHLHQERPKLHTSIEVLEDKNWERAWMDDFKPQQFGNRLWICPSWHSPPDPKAVNLLLDPGLAFGTGTHPTTALCLTWLDQHDLSGKTLMDYGCGSGILSLAALKLGAQQVYAVDIDEQALQATKANAEKNDLDGSQLVVNFPEQLQENTVDIVIANILLDPLKTLKDTFFRFLRPEGTLTVSGLLQDQATSLIKHYEAQFSLTNDSESDGWSLLEFKRQ